MIRHYLFPVVGIILGFSACRSSETNEKQVLMVKTETVKNYENELQVTYPGRVKAAADVDLAFRVAGPIIRIPVQVGSFVRKGEVIAEIDPRDYELQYKACLLYTSKKNRRIRAYFDIAGICRPHYSEIDRDT